MQKSGPKALQQDRQTECSKTSTHSILQSLKRSEEDLTIEPALHLLILQCLESQSSESVGEAILESEMMGLSAGADSESRGQSRSARAELSRYDMAELSREPGGKR